MECIFGTGLSELDLQVTSTVNFLWIDNEITDCIGMAGTKRFSVQKQRTVLDTIRFHQILIPMLPCIDAHCWLQQAALRLAYLGLGRYALLNHYHYYYVIGGNEKLKVSNRYRLQVPGIVAIAQ